MSAVVQTRQAAQDVKSEIVPTATEKRRSAGHELPGARTRLESTDTALVERIAHLEAAVQAQQTDFIAQAKVERKLGERQLH